MAVYDGLGGAGAGSWSKRRNGNTLTEAYVASRLTRLTLERWFADSLILGSAETDELATRLQDDLRAAANPQRSRVGGSLVRPLPTTMACIEYLDKDKTITLDVRWAGDSRAYLLGPEAGLQQLSTDDSHESDALQLLLDNPPMSNMISADRRGFRINHTTHHVDASAILICATDGCFGYVKSPPHFEYLVLSAIENSVNLRDCAELVAAEIKSITGDDASMVLAAPGYDSFESIKSAYRKRLDDIRRRFIDPLDAAAPNSQAYTEVRAGLWKEYKSNYEARMFTPTSPDVTTT